MRNRINQPTLTFCSATVLTLALIMGSTTPAFAQPLQVVGPIDFIGPIIRFGPPGPPPVVVIEVAGAGPYRLDVAGLAHATSFPTSSDARLKENVTPLTGALDKLEKVRGVSFDWNKTYAAMGRSSGHREIGVIAQEVEAVFPELITQWGDEGYRAVDYGRLTGVLIEALKELRAENAKLEQRVETLENLKSSH